MMIKKNIYWAAVFAWILLSVYILYSYLSSDLLGGENLVKYTMEMMVITFPLGFIGLQFLSILSEMIVMPNGFINSEDVIVLPSFYRFFERKINSR